MDNAVSFMGQPMFGDPLCPQLWPQAPLGNKACSSLPGVKTDLASVALQTLGLQSLAETPMPTPYPVPPTPSRQDPAAHLTDVQLRADGTSLGPQSHLGGCSWVGPAGHPWFTIRAPCCPSQALPQSWTRQLECHKVPGACPTWEKVLNLWTDRPRL